MTELLSNYSSVEKASKSQAVVQEALRWIGHTSVKFRDSKPGDIPDEGFCCSGFITFILNKTGIYVPVEIRKAVQYFDFFGIPVNLGFQKQGDLVFFSKKGTYPSHMGIVLSKNEYIHAPGKDNTVVSIAILKEKIIPKDQSAIQRYRVNPIGFKRFSF